MTTLDFNVTDDFVKNMFPEMVEKLADFVKLPILSPSTNSKWFEDSSLLNALVMFKKYFDSSFAQVDGTTSKILSLQKNEKQLSPVLLCTIPECNLGNMSDFKHKNVLIYSHADKQPPCDVDKWKPGTSPYGAEIVTDENGSYMYGRGSADDGYALFSTVAALKSLRSNNMPHPAVTLLIETSEESGSCHLAPYLEYLQDSTNVDCIPVPDLVLCLDAGGIDHKRLWITSSLRGAFVGSLKVKCLDKDVHSGEYGGIVPSSFVIAQKILDEVRSTNLMDMSLVNVEECNTEIPEDVIKKAEQLIHQMSHNCIPEQPLYGKSLKDQCCVHSSSSPADLLKLYLQRSWRPILTEVGSSLPAPEKSGNSIKEGIDLALSIRIPPSVNDKVAIEGFKKAVDKAAQKYGFQDNVSFDSQMSCSGWQMNSLGNSLEEIINNSSKRVFGNETLYGCEGGSIPFMGMLQKSYPNAKFIVTGVLGPNSNAHGPSERIDLDVFLKVTQCVSEILGNYSINE